MVIFAKDWTLVSSNMKALLLILILVLCGQYILNSMEVDGILQQMHGDNGNGMEMNL